MRTIYELWVAFAAAIAAALKPRSFLELPLNRRLMVSSNAIRRIL